MLNLSRPALAALAAVTLALLGAPAAHAATTTIGPQSFGGRVYTCGPGAQVVSPVDATVSASRVTKLQYSNIGEAGQQMTVEVLAATPTAGQYRVEALIPVTTDATAGVRTVDVADVALTAGTKRLGIYSVSQGSPCMTFGSGGPDYTVSFGAREPAVGDIIDLSQQDDGDNRVAVNAQLTVETGLIGYGQGTFGEAGTFGFEAYDDGSGLTGSLSITGPNGKRTRTGPLTCVSQASGGGALVLGIQDTTSREPGFREYYLQDGGTSGTDKLVGVGLRSTPPIFGCARSATNLRNAGIGRALTGGFITIPSAGGVVGPADPT